VRLVLAGYDPAVAALCRPGELRTFQGLGDPSAAVTAPDSREIVLRQSGFPVAVLERREADHRLAVERDQHELFRQRLGHPAVEGLDLCLLRGRDVCNAFCPDLVCAAVVLRSELFDLDTRRRRRGLLLPELAHELDAALELDEAVTRGEGEAGRAVFPHSSGRDVTTDRARMVET